MENPLYQPAPNSLCLIETLGYRPSEGCRHLDLHLARLQRSAEALGFRSDLKAIRNRLHAIASTRPLRCRLTVARDGSHSLQTAAFHKETRPWSVAIAPQRLAADDPWLRHKTTRRALYDEMRAALPDAVDEWLFFNDRDELCEGTITNIFVTKANGEMVTPAAGCGLLPGVFRQTLLASGRCTEQVVTRQDLFQCRAISVGNSLRGGLGAVLCDVKA